jgi:hypothetical protein
MGFGNPRERRRRLEDIHEVMESLRADVPAPDLTAAILARVGEARPFTDARTRRCMLAWRVGAVGSLAMLALGVALVHRLAPAATGWAGPARERPLSAVVDLVQVSTTSGYEALRTTYEAVSDPVSSVKARLVLTGAAAQPGQGEPSPTVVPIARMGRVAAVRAPGAAVVEPGRGRNGPSAAVATAAALRPILPRQAYERVIGYASRLAMPPASLPADDGILPAVDGLPGGIFAR